MTIPSTYTILSHTDTGQYLSHFLFFDPGSLTWTKNLDEVLCFKSHSDAESNARLVLTRLDDPTNQRVGLKSAKAEVKDGELEVQSWYPVNVCLVA